MVDVNTGEPLAIASWPTFDLANLLDPEVYAAITADENDPLYNRATMGTYAPGSTFKPVVGMAALLEGKIELTTTIECNAEFDKYANEGYSPGAGFTDRAATT